MSIIKGRGNVMERTVYRFETKPGLGIYVGSHRLSNKALAIKNEWMSVYWENMEERPTACEDFSNWDGHIFGCKTLQQLRDWFNFNHVKAFDGFLTCRDVKLVTYESTEIIEGHSGKQVIFKPIPETRKVLKGEDVKILLDITSTKE